MRDQINSDAHWWEYLNEADQIGGAGLLIGSAIIALGDLSRFDALRLRGREAVHLIVGCVPLLVVAGTIEGFISPAPIHPAFKFATAAATGVALYTYLLLGGREPEAEARGSSFIMGETKGAKET